MTIPVYRFAIAIEAVDEKNYGQGVALSRIQCVLNQLPPGMTWRIRKGGNQ